VAAFLRRMGKSKWIYGENTGAEIAEAALVLPILFMILLGIYWFGRAFNVYATINHAAREGARAAVVSTCATCGNVPAPTGNPSTITNAVIAALQASHVDTSKIGKQGCSAPAPVAQCSTGYSCNTDPSTDIQVCTGVQFKPDNADGPEICGDSVSFGYPYDLHIPLSSVGHLCLKADVQMQGEN
jgi:Flp pilus assembly protein TadG